MWHLSWQHFRRHWRLNFIVWGIMLLAAALLASLPLLATVLAEDYLDELLETAPIAGRHLLAEGRDLPDDVVALLNNPLLTELVTEQIEIWEINEAADILFLRDGEEVPFPTLLLDRLRVDLRSFGDLEAATTLLNGRYPEPSSDPSAAEVEIAVGLSAVEELQIQLGDKIKLAESNEFGELIEDEDAVIKVLEVVGIVEAADPFADRWWGDQLLLPFGFWRRFDQEQDFLEVTMGAFAHPETMQSHFFADRSWRLMIDYERITAFNVLQIGNALRGTEVALTSDNIRLSTQLVQLVDEYEQELRRAEVSLLLLSSQTLLAVAYVLILVSSFMLEQSQQELVTMLGRGMSRWQAIGLFGGQTAVLAFLLAWPLGVLLVWGVFTLAVDQLFLPSNSWWLALVGVSVCWLAILIPLVRTTTQRAEEWLRQQDRAENGRYRLQTLIFDVVLLSLGGLFYWQLRQTGQVTAEAANEASGIADPVLLLGPTLLLLAIALIFTRLFPLLLRLVAWLSRRGDGFLTQFSLTRMARDSIAPNRIIFLICLTAGLTLFALVFEESVTTRQREMALYRAGADVRFSPPAGTTLVPTIEPTWERWEGVTVSTNVYRGELGTNDSTTSIRFLAVEPEKFSAVSAYPRGFSDVSLASAMNLVRPSQPDAIPALLSRRNVIQGVKVGDVLTLRLTSIQNVQIEVVGIVENFPTIEAPFIVTDLNLLAEQSPLDHTMLYAGVHERWLAVEEAHHEAVVEGVLALRDLLAVNWSQLLGDRLALLQAYQSDLISQQVMGAFQLNAVVLVVLSAAAFFVVQLFSARRRLPSMNVLQALGVSVEQNGRLLTLEGVLVLGFGLLAGLGLGVGMAWLMSPFLTLTLSSSIGGVDSAPLIYEWAVLGQFLLLIIGLYLVMLFVFGRRFNQQQLVQTLRLGEE